MKRISKRWICTAASTLLILTVSAQILSTNATFENDDIGSLPALAPGIVSSPSGISSSATSGISVQNISGDVGMSTASGNVLAIDAPQSGDYRIVEFDGTTNTGILSSDTVCISFDYIQYAATENDGFAFLRSFDESGESFADIAFIGNGDSYTINLMDYDPVTGEFYGFVAPAYPANSFESGVWHHLEVIIDLNNNILKLKVDGVDFGVSAGISRATGTGYLGSFINWGTSFVGQAAIDNYQIKHSASSSLPLAPQGFIDLLTPEDYGGNVIRIPNADLRQPGIDWEGSINFGRLLLHPVYDGYTSYKLVDFDALDEADSRQFAKGMFPILPNRSYEVSALIRTHFPRATWELNIGIHGAETEDDISLGGRYGGMPAITDGPDGWERWTWRITPHWDKRYDFAKVFLGIHEYGPGFNDSVSFEIADLAFIELPEVPLTAFAPGQGVTFPGGAGTLDMNIENVQDNGDSILVTVSAADFIFNKTDNTLTVNQRIDLKRTLTTLSSLSLDGLIVSSENDTEVVLVGDHMTIGVQVDGMLVISPHQPLNVSIESAIGGDFNRLSGPDLISEDDFGGFTANIYTPKGTGVVSDFEEITPNLPFINLSPDDLESTGEVDTTWQVSANILPGERLFISAFPSKPYDWEKSFDHQWSLSDYSEDPSEYNSPEYTDDWILWNISERAWGMSFGERYELRSDVPYQPHWDAIDAAGDKWSAYFSQWFYYSRDAQEWVDEIQRWRDDYGMGVVYSDGLAQDDWLQAYIAMRLLRQDVFPDGDIIIHDSYPQSGLAAAAFKPFIYAYATSTYMGENAVVDAGAEWAWARYAMAQYRRSNAFGVIKGDGWDGFQNVERYKVGLVWGGRGRPDVSNYDTEYMPILNSLKTLWETYGDDPYFFDRYYHPEAQILTGYDIGRAGMPISDVDTLPSGNMNVSFSTWTPEATIYYTIDGSEPNEESIAFSTPIEWDGQILIRSIAIRDDLDPSRILDLGSENMDPVDISLTWNASFICTSRSVTIDLYSPGTALLFQSVETIVDTEGLASFTIAGNGTYDVFIKIDGFLTVGLANTVLDSNSTLTLDNLVSGDFNNDNGINLLDVTQFVPTFGADSSQASYIVMHDLDCDGGINISDFTAFGVNYGSQGDQPPLVP